MEEFFKKENSLESTNSTESSSGGFIFPLELEETKEAMNKANDDINASVKAFAENLDGIDLWLTGKLVEIFETFKNDTNKYRWLSESDLWCSALGELYKRNKDKISYQLERILTEMLRLLDQYHSLVEKSRSLEEMLRACAYIEHRSNFNYSVLDNEKTENKPDSPVNNTQPKENIPHISGSTFTPPPTSHRWWRP